MTMTSSEIRQAFIDYFTKRGHTFVESSALVPANDPSLLFTNAGMVQFKEVFLGLEPRPYTRAVTVQRCVRAGGKHNDLENVGYTARHHTFFEMLGNFSFGDYFKKEAIQFAWTFLTEIMQLPAERLWVTVYHEDKEAEDIWLNEMGISPDRFSRCGEEDNFWSMGDTGPCGPCTEIFYDHGSSVAGGPPGSADQEGDRYIEIWNLVFMQFNRDKQGQLTPLPKPSVDTGMGLERLAAVVQGVHSNYETDRFHDLIQCIAAKGEHLDPKLPSLKVIADHLRSASFLIADGISPSNEGRGYVLRRIIRRAVRHGNQLGLATPFLSQLVASLIEIMGPGYTELAASQKNIETLLAQEERQFAKTLDFGLSLLKEEMQTLPAPLLPGSIAFKLYDTYGFPIDLTADIVREQGIAVDMEGFEALMQQQRAQSQSSSQFNLDYQDPALLRHVSEFHGYEKEKMDSCILSLLQDGREVKTFEVGAKGAVILNHTPFYAESGGQVGDLGFLLSSGASFRVEDTQKLGQAVLHYGELLQGRLEINDKVHAEINSDRRNAIRLNHTATHLLHAALKRILGSQVQQKGSLVEAERARFDFSYPKAVSREQIQDLEILVNDQIRANHEVVTSVMDLAEAKQAGALALFGEKYTEKVRVLSLGDFSKELCGGTHAARTGDIGLFKITAEYGIASGIRRIEMLTGHTALQWSQTQQGILDSAAESLKTTVPQLQDKLNQLLVQSKHQDKEIIRLQNEKAEQSGKDLLNEIETVHGVELLIKQLQGIDNAGLRSTLDQLRSRLHSAVLVLFTLEEGKINVLAGVSRTLVGKVPSAVDLVKRLCGKGGGRDDMAQGGGLIPEDFKQRLEALRTYLHQSLMSNQRQ